MENPFIRPTFEALTHNHVRSHRAVNIDHVHQMCSQYGASCPFDLDQEVIWSGERYLVSEIRWVPRLFTPVDMLEPARNWRVWLRRVVTAPASSRSGYRRRGAESLLEVHAKVPGGQVRCVGVPAPVDAEEAAWSDFLRHRRCEGLGA